MARIPSRGNKATELALAKLLRQNGITGWRRQSKMFGKPDFAFHKQRLIIFVDGCFWHGCPSHSNMPTNNKDFWASKLTGNQRRDRFVTRTLRKEGWTVLRIWEHDLARKHISRVLLRIRRALVRAS